MTRIRHATAALATAAAASAFVAIPAVQAAQAVEVAPSHITVHSSDYDVASGQQFALHGVMTSEGHEVAHTTVKVKAWRAGAWHQLPGAVVNSRDDGHYRVRVILQMKGDRLLRVVGIPPTADIARAHHNVTIHVH